MVTVRQYDQETRDRAVRMYQNRRRDFPDESMRSRRRRRFPPGGARPQSAVIVDYIDDRPPSTPLATATHALTILIEQRLILKVGHFSSREDLDLSVVSPLCPLDVPSTDLRQAARLIADAERVACVPQPCPIVGWPSGHGNRRNRKLRPPR